VGDFLRGIRVPELNLGDGLATALIAIVLVRTQERHGGNPISLRPRFFLPFLQRRCDPIGVLPLLAAESSLRRRPRCEGPRKCFPLQYREIILTGLRPP